MSRNYPLLRLSPDAAGRLQHEHTRAVARLETITAELKELENQVRTEYGAATLWRLRAAARNQVTLKQLKREVAA
ncbi:hypothetical protein [Pseudomonas sp. S9]|uniref:hypothetical protein n=1 Tax=Pseudomonas sp. S9 TaxID=686578 RepID=UPI0002556FE0|nr:hypothetical protein [Pseudomonas sp. S9]